MTIQNKTQKRMLGIVGSPRRGGNTETLVDEVLRGAEESGVLTEKIILSEQRIAPCRACQACWTSGKCVQKVKEFPEILVAAYRIGKEVLYNEQY